MKALFKILGRTSKPTTFSSICPERPVWVIGDVHGRFDLLNQILEKIETHPVAHANVVMVGDYVDRGDESDKVLSMLHNLDQQLDGLTLLMGNHEEMMLEFLESPESHGRRWLRNGGLQTLASYGIGGLSEAAPNELLKEASERLRSAMPAGQEDWLKALPKQWNQGNLHVVHAGADPNTPMSFQSAATLIWGHPDFFTTPRDDDQWVVHGHTITDQPGPDGQGRIAVDTGAYYSGILTAALIDPDGTVSLVQT